MTDAEGARLLSAIAELARQFQAWSIDYRYDSKTNEFAYRGGGAAPSLESARVRDWFNNA